MRYASRRRTQIRAAASFGAAVASLAALAFGDTVTLRGRPPFERVEVLTYKQGIVHFRGLSKQTLRKPVAEIESLAIDGHGSLNTAESAQAARRWDEALSAYDVAAASASGWLSDLIVARRMAALDASGAFDRAVEAFIAAVRTANGLGTIPRPTSPGPTGAHANRAAAEALELALRASANPDERRQFRSLLLEITLVEDQAPPARTFPPLNPEVAPPASQPTRDRRIRINLPPSRQPAQKSDIVTLPAETMVRPHVERLLAAGSAAQAVRTIERSIPFVANDKRPAWNLLLGRARIEAGQAAQAAGDLVTLAEESSDAAIACEALYYAALAHERLDRPDVAAALYRELRGRGDLPAELREKVAEGLERVD